MKPVENMNTNHSGTSYHSPQGLHEGFQANDPATSSNVLLFAGTSRFHIFKLGKNLKDLQFSPMDHRLTASLPSESCSYLIINFHTFVNNQKLKNYCMNQSVLNKMFCKTALIPIDLFTKQMHSEKSNVAFQQSISQLLETVVFYSKSSI